MNQNRIRKTFKGKSVWVVLYAIYLSLILLSIYVFAAQDSVEDVIGDMDEKYTYDLTFPRDGKNSYYDIERHDTGIPGKLTFTYWTQDNKLDFDSIENIKTLEIDVQAMFEAESMKLFKKTTSEMPNLHMDYWLEAGDGVFTIEFDNNESKPLENLTFTKFPEPKSVLVDNQEWWKTETNYVTSDDKITISNIPTGQTEVYIYFKEINKQPVAAFTTSPSGYAGVNEEVTFNGGTSNDPDGDIVSWVWNFGDGNNDSGKSVVHKYTKPGNYTIRLTVRDDAEPFGESWVEKSITVAFGAEDDYDSDGMRDIWEWGHFGTLDEDWDDDKDNDGATNKEEHDADTDPTDYESKPKEKGKSKESAEMDLTVIIAIIVIVIVLLVVIMVVFKSKKTKEKEKEQDDEAIIEMEAKIAQAKKLGLPTRDMERLLQQAKEGEPLEAKPVREKKGHARGKAKGKARSKGRGKN